MVKNKMTYSQIINFRNLIEICAIRDERKLFQRLKRGAGKSLKRVLFPGRALKNKENHSKVIVTGSWKRGYDEEIYWREKVLKKCVP